MSNKDQDINLIGGTLGGPVEAPKKPESKVVRLTPRKEEPGRGAPTKYVEQARKSILSEWAARPPLDAQAEILCLDAWQRKIEIHAPGWEAAHAVQRRFTVGEVLYTTHGLMASSLEKDEYMQVSNADLQSFQDIIANEGKPIYGTKNIPGPLKVEVCGAREITVGLCPIIEVKVIEGPLKGLVMAQYPDMLVDAEGVNGYGMRDRSKAPTITESKIKRDRYNG